MDGWEKILPNQAFNRNLAALTDGPVEKQIYDCILDVGKVRAPADAFDLETSDRFSVEEMASSPITLSLLQWLIRLSGAKTAIEIGAFIGVSALYMASAMPPAGRLLSLEKFPEFAAIARRNIERNGLTDRIELRVADAAQVLPEIARAYRFDFAFIDGNKENYATYMHELAGAINPGGVMVVDDAFFHGDALRRSPTTEKGRGVRAALELAKSMAGWDLAFLPISNGMLLLRKSA